MSKEGQGKGAYAVLSGICVVCGAGREDAEARCECGAPRPPSGWSREGHVGMRLPDPEGWLIRRRLEEIGPVSTYRVLAPPNRPEPRQAIAQVVMNLDYRDIAVARSVALANARHASLARVLGMGKLEDGSAYRVDVPEEGIPAGELLGRSGPMPLEQVLDIGRSLAAALTELHGRGIVHGNLSLESVVFVQGNDQRPLIAGLPAVPAGPWFHHAAPEVQMGGSADPRTDVFGLGYVLVSLLRGSAADGDGRDPAWRVGSPGPAFPLPKQQTLPPDVESLLDKMIDRDPDRRPHSVVEVAMALRPSLEPDVQPRPGAPPGVVAIVTLGIFIVLGLVWGAKSIRGPDAVVVAAPDPPAVDVVAPPASTDPVPPEIPAPSTTDAPAVVEAPVDPPAATTPPELPSLTPAPGPPLSPQALSGVWSGVVGDKEEPISLDLVFGPNGQLFGEGTLPARSAGLSKNGVPNLARWPLNGRYEVTEGTARVVLTVGEGADALRLEGILLEASVSGSAFRGGSAVGDWSARLVPPR